MRNIFFMILLISATCARAQVATSFPSLLIKSNSRGMGMGDLGIASAEGTQQLLYNPAKTAFTKYFHSFSVGYMPWLTGISQDTRMMNASYLSNAENTAWGVSLNYLNMGQMDTRDENGATLSSYSAREYNVGGSLAIRLNENHGLSTTLRFLAQNAFLPNPTNTYSACGDVGYYGFAQVGSASNKIEWAATVSNLGSAKLNLAASVGIGIGYLKQSERNSFAVSFDANRLLKDSLNSIRYAAGVEYGLQEQFFLRAGVSLEKQSGGNRKYFSFGAGYKGFVSEQAWNIDFHYLVPFGSGSGLSPYQNGWGLTLGIQLGNFQ
jgi:hypothetical protein